MEIIDIIRNRRTTRAFKSDEQIKDEDLNLILEAGIWAPTGHNLQPWFFTVIQKKDLIKRLNILAKDAGKDSKDDITLKMCNNEMLDLFYGAPTIIIVSYHKNALTPIEDVATASQNILLTAESLNIASCWNGIVRMFFAKITDGEKELFGIPEDFIPHNIVALGYPKIKVMNAPPRTKTYSKILK